MCDILHGNTRIQHIHMGMTNIASAATIPFTSVTTAIFTCRAGMAYRWYGKKFAGGLEPRGPVGPSQHFKFLNYV